jgi:hypothetical protein
MEYAETLDGDHNLGIWMPRTPTIDLIVVVSGQKDLAFDGGESMHILPGAPLCSRARCQGWRIAGNELCVSVAVMTREIRCLNPPLGQ